MNCNKCTLDKDQSEFYKKKNCSTGYSKICKLCVIIKVKSSYNKEKRSLYNKEQRTLVQNNEKLRNERNLNNRIRYHTKTKKKHNELTKRYYKNNKEKASKLAKEYYLNNKKSYRNRDAKRRAKEIQADLASKWKSKELMNKIKEIYLNCPDGFEVDHIIPLTNDMVCGLHVPCNLQYLSVYENRSKSNKLEINPC